MMDRVQQLTQNPKLFMDYQQWLGEPMTKLVFDCMMEMLMAEGAQAMKLVGIQGVSIELNALENARMKGNFECLARMVSFSDKQLEQQPEEDYGANAVPFNQN